MVGACWLNSTLTSGSRTSWSWHKPLASTWRPGVWLRLSGPFFLRASRFLGFLVFLGIFGLCKVQLESSQSGVHEALALRGLRDALVPTTANSLFEVFTVLCMYPSTTSILSRPWSREQQDPKPLPQISFRSRNPKPHPKLKPLKALNSTLTFKCFAKLPDLQRKCLEAKASLHQKMVRIPLGVRGVGMAVRFWI